MTRSYSGALLFFLLLSLTLVISCRKKAGENLAPVLPPLVRLGTTVFTDSVLPSNVTATTAKLTAKISSIGVKISEYGFYYSTSSSLSAPNTKVIVGSAPATLPFVFQSNVSGLVNSTTYYVRAFVKDSTGIVYGETKLFKTASNAVAIVQTTAVSNITYFTAQTGGTITFKGSTNITEYGVVYSATNASPSTADTKIISGTTSPATVPSTYAATLTNLVGNTVYYVRAYATNGGGTAYGATLSFTTVDARPKVSTTRMPYGADTRSVSANGSIDAQGASTITRFGFVYSTSATPTLADNVADVGTSVTGTFPYPFNATISFARMTAGTYYMRAFASNASGVTYGNAMSVTVYFNPTLVTGDYTLAAYIATLSGTITTGGSAAIQEYGFVYLPTANATFGFNYGDVGVTTLKGTGTASTFPFAYSLPTPSGTATNTFFSYKAYARTTNGIVYGEVKTFYINSKD